MIMIIAGRGPFIIDIKIYFSRESDNSAETPCIYYSYLLVKEASKGSVNVSM
jgi:hypothetical protein